MSLYFLIRGKMGEKKLIIERYFSSFGNPYEDPKNIMDYSKRDAIVTNDKGEAVERLDNLIFPSFWSYNASNTVATKYFKKTDVPETKREIDIRQLTGRVAKTIAEWGVKQNYLDNSEAKMLEEEIVALSVGQYGCYNSPVWFNLGLDKYGISKSEEGFYHIENGEVVETKDYYVHPQISACFISSPEDSISDMMNVGAVVSARIFKNGSGIGGDWSKVRSAAEPISMGGVTSGAKRFMDVQDATARVIKSGGTTRRAATMQSMAIWHYDAIDLMIDKYKEERKGEILIENGSPGNWESHTIQDLRSQNVNISLRIDDEFWTAYEKNSLYRRHQIKGKDFKEESARKLAKIVAFSTHGCADPGIQNHSIINKWNTCKNSGEIWASNPCSEYMFLNNSACNLASLNLMRFRKTDGEFDVDSFCKAVDLYIISQDIMVSQASYPLEEIALNSHKFRPLGLGYANLGAYIMSLGLPYDSDEARNFASAVTSLMTAESYLQSTILAEQIGTFQEFEKNKKPMLEVIEMHRKVSKKIPLKNGLENIINTANKKWDEVIERGEKYGFRNAQTTLLAPTGTIGFMMDCDTTGCEPVYALKAYKELSGGGSMNIVNQTVPLALKRLGYDEATIFSKIIPYINGNETIEGCEYLEEEHLPVFDCAVSSGNGTRAIFPIGHIKMLGAIQPFVSGSISKTINCPENTSVDEVENMFYQGWKHGVKAVAIYRYGSKVSQPLTTKKNSRLEILSRGKREPLPSLRKGETQKVKIGGISLFVRSGEYNDGRLGEIWVDSLERGSEINRLLNENAIQFSEKLQYGVPLKEALEIFSKVGKSQISGLTDHPFIKTANGIEGFLFDWIRAHYLGDISFILKVVEMRPLPEELIVYQKVPKLHLFPTVEGLKFYPGVPSLEETIKKISEVNYWEDKDEGLDTRRTIDKIKKTRIWNTENNIKSFESGKITGKVCEACGNLMVSDGNCYKCPHCKTSTGGCGAG